MPVVSNRGKRFPPHPIEVADIRKLCRACGPSWTGRRNRALIVVLWRAGLRLNEALELRLNDLRELEDGALVIRVEKPKGFNRGVPPREVAIDSVSADEVRMWIHTRATRVANTDRLFCTHSGGKLSSGYVRDLLPRLARRAKIERRVHPHAFRHTFAAELYHETRDPLLIMLALGHTSLGTTTTYLRRIGATEVVPKTALRRIRPLTPTTHSVD